MKLRNKKNGVVVDVDVYATSEYLNCREIKSNFGKPISLASLNEDWEDVAQEPLIKDEEIRRALRYWADVMEVDTVEYDSYWHSFRRDNSTICFRDIDDSYFPLEDGKDYTIAELCGEDRDE